MVISNCKLCMYQFFAEFNSKLILSASNYFIRRQAVQVRYFPLTLFSIVYHYEVFLPSGSISTQKFTNLISSYPICPMCKWYSSQLLRDILLERSNSAVMMRYVSSKEHLMIQMNLLRVRIFPPAF